VLNEISKKSGKSKKIILFEFYKDTHPRIFKRWMKNQKLIKTGKMTGDGCNTYIEIVDGKFVERKT